MKRQNFFTVFISGSGAITGFLVFLLTLQANNKILNFSNANFLLLILLIIFFILLFIFLWILVSFLFIKIFKDNNINIILKNIGYIFLIPYLTLPLLIIFFIKYKSLLNIKLKVLGNIYLPFLNYIHYNSAGYFNFLIINFIIVTICFLTMIYFFKKLYMYNIKINEKKIKKYIFINFFIFYICINTFITIIYPPTGDEPHHLLIMKSLMNDKDLNLKNNFLNKTYKEFYPDELKIKTIHNYKGKDGGIYSIHYPGISILVMPFYKLAKRFGVQIFINFLTAILMTLFYMFLRKNNIKNEISILITFILGTTIPVLPMSSLVLSEIPAAIIILYFFYKIIDSGINLKEKILIFSGIAFLPWLHPKFALLSLILYLYYYYKNIKEKNIKTQDEILNNSIVFISFLFYIFINYKITGKFVIFALTNNLISKDFYFIFSIKHSIKAFLAIFFDINFGLFTYNLFLIISIWGLIFIFQKKDIKKIIPVILTLPHFCIFLFWNDWSGSMTPGRQMIPVFLLLFGLPIAYILNEKSYILKTKIFKIFLVYSLMISYILTVLPPLRYSSGKDTLFNLIGKLKQIFLWIFPSFHDKINITHFSTFIYFIIIIISYKYISRKREK